MDGREGEGRSGRSEEDAAYFRMEVGRTGEGGPGSGGQSCWRRAGATAKAGRASGVWKGILECEDGECEVQRGSPNEMLIGMRREAYLGRDQR